ncbi:hypothetical protein ACEUZ9_004096 [Paracoccus litorisediminis]|uniref:hypothetical protein n=1 Tax=Paracoccus litorisediminis TaxID=2006130 RepID=UPI003731F6D4
MRNIAITRCDPLMLDRTIVHLKKRPWLADEIRPYENNIIGRGYLSPDVIICNGLALGDWPGWLIFGEVAPPPQSGFLRLLYDKLSRLDPKVTGPVQTWLRRTLSDEVLVTAREVDAWFSGHELPRPEVFPLLAQLLGIGDEELRRARAWVEPPQPPISDMVLHPADPEAVTIRHPIGNAPDGANFFKGDALNTRLNAQRVNRILTEAAGVEADTRLVARWLRHELAPSELEIQILNERLPRNPELSSRYRREVAIGQDLIKKSFLVMEKRERLAITFRERVAIALDASGKVPLSAPKKDRFDMLAKLGIDLQSAWLIEEKLAPRADIEILACATDCYSRWFSEAVASPHSILAA